MTTSKKILITGGCGYIGSHTAIDLLEKGYTVISIDNFSNSNAWVVDRIKKITGKNFINYAVDCCNVQDVIKIFNQHTDIAGIIHFAAFKSVNESVLNPLLYFTNNIQSLLTILSVAKEYHIKNFVFSSSCSVYGNALVLPVTENTPLQVPESPYARTKAMSEDILQDVAKSSENNFISLRYFNPAGAHESGEIGEAPPTEPTNIIPSITQTAIGKKAVFTVYGDDYNTRDGSCLRDYIHVMDIAEAHTKALQYVMNNKQTSNYEIFNLGSGEGVTVLELIHAFEKISGKKLNYTIGLRRAGDVVAIYADNKKAKKYLEWACKRTVEDIMRTAWQWERYINDAML